VKKRQKKRGKSAGRGPELIAEESCLKEKREKQYQFPPNEQSLKFVSAKILPLIYLVFCDITPPLAQPGLVYQ